MYSGVLQLEFAQCSYRRETVYNDLLEKHSCLVSSFINEAI